uniref:Uncharacterized protein n=1 Tax=Timema poppense TaxID=170557 RepID=A0A7R9H899_TIMPO|nr:unnamed protein product [Timema poppensis]
MFSIVSANMNTTLGIHGYDNAESNMHPYFIARGPLIKKNHVIAPFDTVDLYSLFAHILNISAPPNNGSLANVVDMLVVMPSHLTATPSVFFMDKGRSVCMAQLWVDTIELKEYENVCSCLETEGETIRGKTTLRTPGCMSPIAGKEDFAS